MRRAWLRPRAWFLQWMEEPKGADDGAAAQRHHQHDGVAPRAIAMISLPAVGMVRARGAGCSSPRRLSRRRDARLASARHVVGGAERLARAKCCHETTNASMMARDGRDGTSRSHGVGERPGGVARNGDLVPHPVEGDVLPYGRECGWPVRAASATHKLPGGRSCAGETFLPAPRPTHNESRADSDRHERHA